MPVTLAPQTRAAHPPSLSSTALANLLASLPLLLFPDLQRRPRHGALVAAGAAGAGAAADEAIGAGATTAGLETAAGLDTAGAGGSAGAGLSTAPVPAPESGVAAA
jgi:hypothetical protein